MNERRMARIQELIKIRVAEVIDQDLSDPRRGMITVTGVKVDTELSSCIVRWSLIGDEKARRLNEKMLDQAAGFVQREVAKILHTRTVPKVQFLFDEGIAKGVEMNELLRDLTSNRGDEEDKKPTANPFRKESPDKNPMSSSDDSPGDEQPKSDS